jgi:hypothetical protein
MKTSAPNSSVTPEWIYGYQCERSKNNLFYNFQGDVVYTISKYAIVYNFASNKQNIFTGHSEEILCLKMHPNKWSGSFSLCDFPLDAAKLFIHHYKSSREAMDSETREFKLGDDLHPLICCFCNAR